MLASVLNLLTWYCPARAGDPIALPADLDLSGRWSLPDPDFIFSTVQLFKRRDSLHPHDYWMVYITGACLATNVHYTAVRFDPLTALLSFSSRHRGGPWRVIQYPSSIFPVAPSSVATPTPAATMHATATSPSSLSSPLEYIFVTYEGMQRMTEEGVVSAQGTILDLPRLVRTLFENSGHTMFMMKRMERGREAGLQEYHIGHGKRCAPSILLALEAKELAKEDHCMKYLT